MNQILLGGLAPYLIGVGLYVARGCRASLKMLAALPVAMAAGMTWAVVPDIPRLLGMHGLYDRLSRDPRCNIFLWHYTIDQIERDSILPAVGVLIMCLTLLFMAWRELSIAEGRD